MQGEPSILSVKDYGQITLHLRELMDARGVTRNQMATAIHARFEVVDKWYRGEVSRIDMDVLARICYVLNCDVQELLIYEKP